MRFSIHTAITSYPVLGAFTTNISESNFRYTQLENAPRALISLLRGGNFGKFLVRVAANGTRQQTQGVVGMEKLGCQPEKHDPKDSGQSCWLSDDVG